MHGRLDLGRLILGDGHQGAFARLVIPDAFICRARGKRTLCQNDELQQRLPDPWAVVDHPLVRQELVQVAAHGPVVVIVGRAEIGQQDANARRRDRRVVGVGMRGSGRGLAGVKHLALVHLLFVAVR